MASGVGDVFGKLRSVISMQRRPKDRSESPPRSSKSSTRPTTAVAASRLAASPLTEATARRTPGAPSRASTLVGAFLEYNPDLDGTADPGEVVWTWVPWEEDSTQGKDRPVVIVGQRDGMLIGVPLTSRQRSDEDQVAVGTGPWDRDGRPSYAKIDLVLEVDPGQVRREGAILSRAHFDELVRALQYS